MSGAADYICDDTSVARTPQFDWDRRLSLSAHTSHVTSATVGSIVDQEVAGIFPDKTVGDIDGSDVARYVYPVGYWVTVDRTGFLYPEIESYNIGYRWVDI